ncbi:MAG: NADH-quinone oxidoreductase subunit NuoK [Chloroflexi bacterium]|uniref:NADH-quinone oxidoreductase subunit K n=1 Tax=Candidatus Chlorohelix allophototropha TaxID=3003348 RepID=A0A8T7M3F5_9CHLR|nr:NADH-quinone oxidoreductase subunit NuoK [Chloroflexota bacterium]WJW67719.1 NADH-quinone oxidoreductase subunit NuoK [Chloroflexota bacterium L227-S17]
MSDVTFGLLISAVIFAVGAMGVLLRRNPLVQFMSIELMLNAVNLALISFSASLGTEEGHIFVLMVLTVAAAEAVIGLGIIVGLFRKRNRIDVDDVHSMDG